MISQSSLPIQNGTGSKPDSSRGVSRYPAAPGTVDARTATFASSFSTQLNENIINVYERSTESAAVPDERTGVDRRQSPNRQQYLPKSAPLRSSENVMAGYLYSTERKTNQTYTRTQNVPPTIFSPSPEKGKFVDVWA